MTDIPLTNPLVARPQDTFDRLETDRRRYQQTGSLSLQECQRLLEEEISYRPNAAITLRPGPSYSEQVVLTIKLKVEDTYDPGAVIRVEHRYPCPEWFIDTEHFVAFVRQCVQKTEVHEAMEWLKWRKTGKPIFDPHSNDVQNLLPGGRRAIPYPTPRP